MARYLWLLKGPHDVMLWLPLFAGKEDGERRQPDESRGGNPYRDLI